MIASSDILHIMLQAEKNLRLAEQMLKRAVEVSGKLNETISDVNLLRRKALFIGKSQSDFVSLASAIIEIEQLRSQLDTLKDRLSVYSASSCSYIATLFSQLYQSSDEMPLTRMGIIIQRLTSIFKNAHGLNIACESTLANAVMMDTIISLQPKLCKSLLISSFARHLRNLIAILS